MKVRINNYSLLAAAILLLAIAILPAAGNPIATPPILPPPPVVIDPPTPIFTLLMPCVIQAGSADILTGENIQARVGGNPNILGAFKSFSVHLSVVSPKGTEVQSVSYDLPINGGAVSLLAMANTYVVSPAIMEGTYTVKGFLKYQLYTKDPKELTLASKNIVVKKSDDLAADDDTILPPGAVSSSTMAPVSVAIKIKVRENLSPWNVIEEDKNYTFTADMSQTQFAGPMNANKAADLVFERFFKGNKMFEPIYPPTVSPEPVGQGGISPGTLVWDWKLFDPYGNSIQTSTPTPVNSDVIADFPYHFKDPTEPAKYRLVLNGDFVLNHYLMHYDFGASGFRQLKEVDFLSLRDEAKLLKLPKKIVKKNNPLQPGFNKSKFKIDLLNLIIPPGQWIKDSNPNPYYIINNKNEKVEVVGREEQEEIHVYPNQQGAGAIIKGFAQINVIFSLKYNGKVWKIDESVRGKDVDLARFETKTETFTNQKSVMRIVVYDTTAPKVDFAVNGGTITGYGDYKITTGDLKLIRVKITDNNPFAAIRIPYLHYEVAPSGGTGANWAGTPLKMDTVDGAFRPPYKTGNSFTWQTFVPAPPNFIGEQCVKWFVDVHDGSSHPRYQSKEYRTGIKRPGNHNKGKMDYDPREGEWEILSDAYGTLSIFDNDRPNMTLKVYEVENQQPRFLYQFSAGEDWNTPDFYDEILNGSGFKGSIPPDSDLLNKAILPTMHPAIYNLYMDKTPELRQMIIDHEPFQVADDSHQKFKYFTDLKGPNVIYEDRRYLFVLEVKDNVEFQASRTAVETLDPMSQVPMLKYLIYDPDAKERMDGLTPVVFRKDGFGSGCWYMGPRNPETDPITKPEVPVFEYVFHSPGSASGINRRKPHLRLAIADARGHERYMFVDFNVIDVQTEFKTYDGQVTRQRGGDDPNRRKPE